MPNRLRRIVLLSVMALGFIGPALVADEPKREPLDARLRRLEKAIAAVRELPFKNPVKAKIIERAEKSDKKLQGYYSVQDKTLYLYNDLSGVYEKGVLIHEMVHALQDQHFDLGKLKSRLHLAHYDNDAELALAALVEGDATLTMIEVLKKDQPKVAAMLGVPLEKAKNLQNAFLYAQGARFVKALKDRGGWATVNASYRFPPRTTASILSLSVVTGIDLGPGKTQGALGVVKLLAGNPETRAQAVQLACAWRGDRELPSGKAGQAGWSLAFSSPENALSFQKALAKVRAAEHADFVATEAQAEEPGTLSARAADGALWEIVVRGPRLLAIEAPSDKVRRQLRDRLDGPPALDVFAGKDKQRLSFGRMIDRLLDADVICIGETHNADLHHRLQAQIIKALYARDERLGVGMEMFQRPFQDAIDRYIRRETSDREFLKATEYAKRWGYDWSLYKPIADFCRNNSIPLAALNAPKELAARMRKVGHAGLTDEEKKQLGKVDFHQKEHRAYWFDRLPKLHGLDKVSPEEQERSYQIMAAWDEYMADSAARFLKERRLRRLVVLAGSGHIDRGFGIPLRAAHRISGRVATIKIVSAEEADGDVVTDYTVVLR